LRWERFPETGPSRVSELRWYVAGGQVVRGAELGEDGRRRTLRPGDAGFARNAPGVLSTAACWRRYAEAGVEGETTCGCGWALLFSERRPDQAPCAAHRD